MEPVTIVGRGHSGTSALAKTLVRSGVFMGPTLNDHWDTVPPDRMYEACLLFAQRIGWSGGFSWDFSEVLSSPPSPEFEDLVGEYLQPVFAGEGDLKGWKLPETTMAFPWIVRMFPRAKYIHIVRDPKDGLLRKHLTDDLALCGIGYPETEDVLARRVASWKYQHEIVKATPRPENFFPVKFEDLVLRRDRTLERLEEFLGFPLARIEMDRTRVGQWRDEPSLLPYLEPIADDLAELGYDDHLVAS